MAAGAAIRKFGSLLSAAIAHLTVSCLGRCHLFGGDVASFASGDVRSHHPAQDFGERLAACEAHVHAFTSGDVDFQVR